MKKEYNQIRLDKILVKNKMARSRDRAIDLIKQDGVYVNGKINKKPGMKISIEDQVTLKKNDIPWVSRGGLKLEEALKVWDINVQNLTCSDVGAATGGFTDVLLYYGARKIYAVDVGKNQLAKKLKNDSRVVNLEKINFKKINKNKIKNKIDLVCIDVSYISLTLILERAKNILKNNGIIVALIKPRFEMEAKAEVGKGVIKDQQKRKKAINKITHFAKEIELEVKDVIESPVLGSKGNREFLAYLKKHY